MISDERMERAIAYHVDTDQPHAELKTEIERQEYKIKAIEAAYITHEEGAIDYRRSLARVSAEYQSAVEAKLNAMDKFNAMHNKRKTEEMVKDCWQTQSANRRQG